MHLRITSICALIAVSCCTACGETSVTRYETVRQARADTLFDRGWVPDVLPEDAGPLIEVHNVESNERCTFAQFPPAAFDIVQTALLRQGFEQHQGPIPKPPFRACPFSADAFGRAAIILRRRGLNGDQEYAAIDKGGTFFFVGTLQKAHAA